MSYTIPYPEISYCWETGNKENAVFIIANNFKNVAIFKNKNLRDKPNAPVYVVWYSTGRNGLMRIGGNVWKYICTVNPFSYTPK